MYLSMHFLTYFWRRGVGKNYRLRHCCLLLVINLKLSGIMVKLSLDEISETTKLQDQDQGQDHLFFQDLDQDHDRFF